MGDQTNAPERIWAEPHPEPLIRKHGVLSACEARPEAMPDGLTGYVRDDVHARVVAERAEAQAARAHVRGLLASAVAARAWLRDELAFYANEANYSPSDPDGRPVSPKIGFDRGARARAALALAPGEQPPAPSVEGDGEPREERPEDALRRVAAECIAITAERNRYCEIVTRLGEVAEEKVLMDGPAASMRAEYVRQIIAVNLAAAAGVQSTTETATGRDEMIGVVNEVFNQHAVPMPWEAADRFAELIVDALRAAAAPATPEVTDG
jgi:hypothetical protein